MGAAGSLHASSYHPWEHKPLKSQVSNESHQIKEMDTWKSSDIATNATVNERGRKGQKMKKSTELNIDWRLMQWLPPRASSIDDDAEALRELYRHKKLEDGRPSGEEWFIKVGWKTFPKDPSRWFGVKVDKGRVRGLTLRSNDLQGPIPREIGSLVKLETLDLSDNKLTGEIPASVVLLTQNQLKAWNLKNNNNLRLPSDIGALTCLTTLEMPAQNLSGKVPDGLKFLKCLKVLDLSQNRFTGPVPGDSFRWMKQLEKIDLTFNLLTGTIPESMASLCFLNSIK